MPLVTIYPVPSSLPSPVWGAPGSWLTQLQGGSEAHGHGSAESCCGSGLGLKLLSERAEVQPACPQVRMEVPCWNVHTTNQQPEPSFVLPTPPSFITCHPQQCFFSLPHSTPLFQQHFPPRCQMDAEEPGTVTHGSDVPRCCSLLPLLESSSRLDTVNGLSTGL